MLHRGPFRGTHDCPKAAHVLLRSTTASAELKRFRSLSQKRARIDKKYQIFLFQN